MPLPIGRSCSPVPGNCSTRNSLLPQGCNRRGTWSQLRGKRSGVLGTGRLSETDRAVGHLSNTNRPRVTCGSSLLLLRGCLCSLCVFPQSTDQEARLHGDVSVADRLSGHSEMAEDVQRRTCDDMTRRRPRPGDIVAAAGYGQHPV